MICVVQVVHRELVSSVPGGQYVFVLWCVILDSWYGVSC